MLKFLSFLSALFLLALVGTVDASAQANGPWYPCHQYAGAEQERCFRAIDDFNCFAAGTATRVPLIGRACRALSPRLDYRPPPLPQTPGIRRSPRSYGEQFSAPQNTPDSYRATAENGRRTTDRARQRRDRSEFSRNVERTYDLLEADSRARRERREPSEFSRNLERTYDQLEADARARRESREPSEFSRNLERTYDQLEADARAQRERREPSEFSRNVQQTYDQRQREWDAYQERESRATTHEQRREEYFRYFEERRQRRDE